MPEIPLDAWLGLVKYLMSIAAIVVFSYLGLKYGLKDVREKLDTHVDMDNQNFQGINVKLDLIQVGISGLRDSLGKHGTELALHDERTKRTAETLAKVEGRLERVDNKLDTVRLNQERLVGRLGAE